MWGCRACDSVIPGPEKGVNKIEWFSQKCKRNINEENGSLLPLPYQWILNLKTGEAKEKYLVANESPFMDFPFINLRFNGLPNKFGYTQVLDSVATSNSGISNSPLLPTILNVGRYMLNCHFEGFEFFNYCYYIIQIVYLLLCSNYFLTMLNLGMFKFGGLAKLHFEEPQTINQFSLVIS